ncbi:FixH family protein [Flavobacterium sp. F-328]|uniref:FixH family protein n=2 Tax=Flavobacterium erciyesense TaxID=2825842 RepID=A0ABS5D220_9FLAO|nr:FixH family protein [Flavobacterium erciyesense]MBQ0908073.1 FixH family protein [Flavobacterium erciyesense]
MENQIGKESNGAAQVSSLKFKGIGWGTGVVIAFGLFMTFILYFVFTVQSESKYDNELVVEEYYKHDAHFGEEMTRIENATNLAQKPIINTVSSGIEIVFPEDFIAKDVTGKVSLYRPSNKKLDFEVPISLSNATTLLIPKKSLAGGRWDINMEWQYKGKSYLSKETIYFN